MSIGENSLVNISGGEVNVGAMAVGAGAQAQNWGGLSSGGRAELTAMAHHLVDLLRAEPMPAELRSALVEDAEALEEELTTAEAPRRGSILSRLAAIAARVGSFAALAEAVDALQQAAGQIL
jgi:hypothetical protein